MPDMKAIDYEKMEIWKSVVRYEGLYEVSNLGRVRSLYFGRPRVRRTYIAPVGYEQLTMYCHGKRRPEAVHVLVLTSFVGPRPPHYEGCHNDGNKLNNHLSNLRWDTKASNEADKIRHGTFGRGERHSQAKLTEQQVVEIRRRYAAGGVSQSDLGREYGVHHGTIWNVVQRAYWKHLVRATPLITAGESEGE